MSGSVKETQLLLSPRKPMKHRHENEAAVKIWGDPLWSSKAMYLVCGMGQSAFNNFLPVFFEHTLFYSKFQIGMLQAMPCICMVLGPLFWGALADKYQNHRAILVLCIGTSGLLVAAMGLSTTFSVSLILLMAFCFQIAPAASLLDQAVLDVTSKYGEEYGKQRMFGAVGYGAGAYLAGRAVELGGIAWAFYLCVLFTAVSLLVLRFIPVIVQHDGSKVGVVGEPWENDKSAPVLQPSLSFLETMKLMVQRTDIFVLLLVVYFMALMYGVLANFLTLDLYNVSGENPQIIGFAILCETASELPAFFYSQRVIKRIGVVNVLVLSILGYAARITYYAFMTNAWSALPFECLHGLTFGLSWAAVTQYIYASAPRGSEATMMGVLNAIQSGLGCGVGTLIGGYFYDHHGRQAMWLATDIGVPLSLAGVALLAYLKPRHEVESDDSKRGGSRDEQ
jgi:oligosaccharide:H+ symporter